MTKGLLLSAPASGSGKTIVTLGLLSAFGARGLDVTGAKAGPDYIDPQFHKSATGKPSLNLDPWAMDNDRLRSLAGCTGSEFLLIEGAMGLFDGAADGTASPASLAKSLGVPVLLVVDGARQSHSIAALVRGFRDHDPDVSLAGVVLNRVGSQRHETMLRQALGSIGVPVMGALPRLEDLVLPERHLGLVQAKEHDALEEFTARAGEVVCKHCSLDALAQCFEPIGKPDNGRPDSRLRPLGQRVAIARDEAFMFTYPHWLRDWREAGADMVFFSPLADEPPPVECDAIFLPGGYPELHGAKLAGASQFKQGMQRAAQVGTFIYGECGGYMVLGEGLVDRQGHRHAMCGLLSLETSFEKPRLHLGYRKIEAVNFPFGRALKGHEFHYSSVMREEGDALFGQVCDALNKPLGRHGLRRVNVMGSYLHVINGITQ